MDEKSLREEAAKHTYHYWCEDTWYSCPESAEGCANDDETECNCGYEHRITELCDLLTRIHKGGRNEGFRDGMLRCLEISNNTPTDGTPPSEDQRDEISKRIKKAIEEIK